MKGTFELRLVIDRDTAADMLILSNIQAVLTADLDDEDADTGGLVTDPDGRMTGHWEWEGEWEGEGEGEGEN